MATILVIHGPNLNRLGLREPEIYGTETLESINAALKQQGQQLGHHVHTFQSNAESALIETIQKAADEKLITGVIIKPNQIGSVSETLEAIRVAQNMDLKIIVSHRSGETSDDFIADLAFGAQADGLKTGAPSQPERLVKYNRLIEIEGRVN